MATKIDDESKQHKSHPDTRTYLTVGAILSIATAFEVWVFYWNLTPWMLAALIFLTSAVKFILVVAYYMHLRFDDRKFLGLFAVPFFIAMFVVIVLLALFSSLTR